MRVRLQKIIARAGLASRRTAEKLISEGKVSVNGEVVTRMGICVDPTRDRIHLNGKPICGQEPKVYLILNKPRGYVTTLKDPQKRPIVTDLIKGVKERVFPVGRLDYDTEGLLLLTNDGILTQRLCHPSSQVLKTYLVGIKGTLTPGEIKKLEVGVVLEDGVTAPARLALARRRRNRSWWEITIHEGRKRQVKRMFKSVGHSICELKRIRFGLLELDKLAPGEHRFLTHREITALKQGLNH